MITYDFSPLFRSTVGFDRLARLAEAALHVDQTAVTYPPYDIVSTDKNSYRITMAVAGFGEDELTMETRDNTLMITGKKAKEEGEANYLHHGIAGRDFVRKFQLAEHVKVTDAYLNNGMLSVDLVREVPEELKPRTIEIKNAEPASLVSKAKKMIEGSSKKKAA